MDIFICAWDWLKVNLSTEFFAALAAIMSFVVVWRQHVWNKRNHIASVSPFLCDFLKMSFSVYSLDFRVMNKGLGPARLVSFSFEWDNNQITRTALRDYLSVHLSENFEIYLVELSELSALASNDSEVILAISLNPNGQVSQSEKDEFTLVKNMLVASFRIKIEYKSILDSTVMTYKTTPLPSLLGEIDIPSEVLKPTSFP